MHSHETCGTGLAQYIAAIEAGCDGVCLARAPLSGGTSQPDLFSMWHALKGTDYDLGIDVEKVMEANRITKECLKDYDFPPEALGVDSEVIFSPMPGGALTANTLMMRESKTFHLYPKVIEAMAECVARGGFGTSVTPVSQFYFQQAYANTLMGKWEKMTDGYGNMVLGYFGKTPVAPDPEIVKIASEQLKKPVFTGDPIKDLEPGIPKAKKLLEDNGLPVNDENIFIVGAFTTKSGNKGIDFLKGNFKVSVPKKDPAKAAAAAAPAPAPAPAAAPTPDVGGNLYHVSIAGQAFDVRVRSH
jgi:pyruvate carboxylase subunit B